MTDQELINRPLVKALSTTIDADDLHGTAAKVARFHANTLRTPAPSCRF